MAVIFEFRYIYSEFRSSKLRFPLIFFFFRVSNCPNSSAFHYGSNDRRIESRIYGSVFLMTCNLILFNADVNWLPGSASPHGYSRQPVL